MSSPFIGQIIQGGWNFAPRDYIFCNGQLQSIAQNTALFSLLGTIYGGDGQTTFGLPNLQGRRMMHWGNGSGLTGRSIGETAGAEQVTLTTANLPAHTHSATLNPTLSAATPIGTRSAPAAGALLAQAIDNGGSGAAVPQIYAPAGTAAAVALGGFNIAGSVAVGITGSNSPVATNSTFQCVSHVIALFGIFPSRN